MKKILLSIGALSLMLTANSQSTPRAILLEHFTQASCGPCATLNPGMETYLTGTGASVNIIPLKYQTSWPGVDPMNAHNPTEVATRVSLYGVSGVPNSVVDGTHFNGGPIGSNFGGVPGWNHATMTSREAVMSPFEVSIDASLSSDLNTISASVKVKASDTTMGTFAAHIVVVEKEIAFGTAPGSNGETTFKNVMKKMLPGSAGTALTSTNWVPGDSVVINQSWTLSNVYDKSELAIIAFVQKSDNEIMQAAIADAALPAGIIIADVSASEAHTVSADLCNTAFTPEITVTNNSTSQIVDTCQVSYTLNGGTPITESIYTTIAAGASYTHAFNSTTLTAGSNTIEYAVNTDADATNDLSTTNNVTPESVISVISSSAFATSHQEGFESLSDFDEVPGNAIVVNPAGIPGLVISSASVNGLSTSLGGFGNSDRSFFIDFFAASTVGSEISLIWEKIDLSANVNSTLEFSHAYAQWTNGTATTNDGLVVSVSTDCGTTWNDVFDESGNSLSTAAPVGGNNRFFATPSDWVSNNVDLSAYDGEGEVMIRFTGVSDYGNSLFLDDINIPESVKSIEEKFASSKDIKMYPNPATNSLTLDFSKLNTTVTKVEIINQLGQVMIEEVVTNLTTNFDVSILTSGIYSVKVYSNEKNFTPKKLTIK